MMIGQDIGIPEIPRIPGMSDMIDIATETLLHTETGQIGTDMGTEEETIEVSSSLFPFLGEQK